VTIIEGFLPELNALRGRNLASDGPSLEPVCAPTMSCHLPVMLQLGLSYSVIMMIFDSSTLILVAKVELLDLFLASIGLEVAIPVEVERECCGVKKTLDAHMIQKALDESRIRVMAVSNKKLMAKLQTDFNLASVLRQAERRLCRARRVRLTFSRISAARAVQMNGFGFSLWWSM
jgi:hypothetical protein